MCRLSIAKARCFKLALFSYAFLLMSEKFTKILQKKDT